MKQIINCLLMILLATGAAFGKQDRVGKQRMHPGKQRIHAAKMAYIADRLKLQQDQSAKFVPVYNQYEDELKDIRKKYYKKYHVKDDKNGQKMDRQAVRYQVEEDLDYQQDVIVLKRKYNDRFLAVLSAPQLSELHVAEREFRSMLVQRLKQRKEKARK